MPEERAPLGPKIRKPLKDHLDEMIREEMGDQRGMVQWCTEAALLYFFDAEPDVRLDYIRRVRDAEFQAGTLGLLAEIKARHPKGKHGKPINQEKDR